MTTEHTDILFRRVDFRGQAIETVQQSVKGFENPGHNGQWE